jgi:hypothetical protein
MIFDLFNSKSRLRGVGGALTLLRRESSRRRGFPTGRVPAWGGGGGKNPGRDDGALVVVVPGS